jgi:hypothetical protein
MIPLPNIKYIITGHGHSGTQWLVQVLNNCGLKAVHEGVFQNDIRPPDEFVPGMQAEISCKAAPRLGQLPPEPRVVYVIRKPLGVISSMFFCPTEHGWAHASRWWVENELGQKLPSDPLAYICEFYVQWHRLIMRHASRLDAVLTLDSCPGSLVQIWGLTMKGNVERCGQHRPAGKKDLTYDDLPEATRAPLRAIEYAFWPGVERMAA